MEPTTNAPNSFANGSGLIPPPKKSKRILKIVLILLGIIIVIGVVWGGLYLFKKDRVESVNQKSAIEIQIEKLNQLSQQSGYKELTPEAISGQIAELRKMSKQTGYKEPTNEDVIKQTEELNKLKTN